jgi:hypothetical protein
MFFGPRRVAHEVGTMSRVHDRHDPDRLSTEAADRSAVEAQSNAIRIHMRNRLNAFKQNRLGCDTGGDLAERTLN